MNAKYHKGVIKKSKNQVKKHIKQMNKFELRYLRNKIENLPNIYFTNHALTNGVDVTIEQIKNTINGYNFIIEYNETINQNGKVDRRVLMRSSTIYNVDFKRVDGSIVKGNANLCFVISIVTGRIITTYYNYIRDNHETIDYRRYDKNLKIIKETI